MAWYESEDDQAAMATRIAKSDGTAVLRDGFVVPS
jgi:hypothetical protein